METQQKEQISHYLDVLKRAQTDNEKFAALLMVAKVTKDDSCSIDVKQEILEAVGSKFFARLLKTKNVPAECSANIFKTVAMSVLSALSTQPDVACSSVLTENITSFNGIILLNPGDNDIEDRQLVDDTYECYNSLCQTSTGMHSLMKAKSASSLCQAVISQSYGHEKAQDVLFCVVSCAGSDAWEGCEPGFHGLLSHFSKLFQEDAGEKKFELCKTLVFLLTTIPRNLDKSNEPPWIKYIVGGLDSILKSKLGANQREPALRLVSMLVQVSGIYSILPPYTPDCKLFLLTTHLCCIEIRMVLENTDLTQASDNGRLLSSCYSYLENIINHMTAGPTLSLDDRQVLQLHSAMVGAFSAVLHFLKRVSMDTSIQWNSIILATVRVLGAWLAEETSALKEEVYELIPFLVQISKMCIPPESGKEQISKSCDNSNKISSKDSSTNENNQDQSETIDNEMETDELNSFMENVTVCDDNEQTMEGNDSDIVKQSGNNLNNQTDQTSETKAEIESRTHSNEHLNDGAQTFEQKCDNESMACDSELENKSTTENQSAFKHVTFNEETTGEHVTDSELKLETKQNTDILTFGDLTPDKDKLSDQDLQDLHVRADIFHFLLPGLCHLTAEDLPRHILLHCGALSVLDLYMWRQWEQFIKFPNSRETQSSLIIMCNIFLNLIIVEPKVAMENQEFAHVLLLVATGIQAVELDPQFIVVWSHLVTLGLMLMRAMAHKIDEFLEKDSVSKFFVSSIRFLSGAYTAKYKKKGQAVLEITENYMVTWDQISQTWFLSMQALSACVPLFGDLPSILLKTGWFPALLKALMDVKGNGIAEETISCFVLLLTTVAKADKAAKKVIKEKGGAEFSRIYKVKELLEVLE